MFDNKHYIILAKLISFFLWYNLVDGNQIFAEGLYAKITPFKNSLRLWCFVRRNKCVLGVIRASERQIFERWCCEGIFAKGFCGSPIGNRYTPSKNAVLQLLSPIVVMVCDKPTSGARLPVQRYTTWFTKVNLSSVLLGLAGQARQKKVFLLLSQLST